MVSVGSGWGPLVGFSEGGSVFHNGRKCFDVLSNNQWLKVLVGCYSSLDHYSERDNCGRIFMANPTNIEG
jgi:hypothetical protein